MKKWTAVCVIFLAVFYCAIAQDGKIYGTVTDGETGEPLLGATIMVGEGRGTSTDLDGKYELELPPSNYNVAFDYVGYGRQAKRVKLESGGELVLNMRLYSIADSIGIVVVTDTKYNKKLGEQTTSIGLLTPTFIENTNSTTMESALNKMSGVDMVGEQVSIRGGSSYSAGSNSRVLMLMDGMPLLTPDDANIEFGTLPLENIEQVEVIKGASSAIYGSGALNGIINLRTANPKNEPYTKIVTYFGFYENPLKGYKKDWYWNDSRSKFGGATFAHRRKFKNGMDLVMGGGFFEDKSYLQHNTKRRVRLNAKFRWISPKIKGLTIGVSTNMASKEEEFFFLWSGWADSPKDSVGQPGFAPPDSLAYVPQELGVLRVVPVNIDPYITYFDKNDNMHSFKTRWYFVQNNNSNGEVSDANQAYGEYTFHGKWSRVGLNFITGISGFYTSVKSQQFSDHNAHNAAAFLQLDKKFFGRLSINVGFRFEYNDIDMTSSEAQPILKAGVNYQLAEATYIRGSWGQGYRFPTIAEKFTSTRRGAARVRPNPLVEPENSWSAEIGINQGLKIGPDWKGYVDVAGFVTYYFDMIEFTLFPGTSPPEFQAVNINDTRIAGFEISGFGEGSIFGYPTNIILGYTYIDPVSLNWNDTIRFIRPNGTPVDGLTYNQTSTSKENILKYRFRHSAKADIETTVKSITVGFTGTLNSFMENIDAFAANINGTIAFREANDGLNFVLDARLAYNFTEKAKVSFIAKNLFNNQYSLRPSYMEAPRNYTFQVAYSF